MTKNEAVDRMKNADLSEESGHLQKITIYDTNDT